MGNHDYWISWANIGFMRRKNCVGIDLPVAAVLVADFYLSHGAAIQKTGLDRITLAQHIIGV